MEARSSVPPQGRIAKPIIAGRTVRPGARINSTLSTPRGMNSSLNISFKLSATGWSSPNGPTRFGPQRSCTQALIFRSKRTRYIAAPRNMFSMRKITTMEVMN